jgi:N-acetylneuraminic acid mutarotase
MNMMKLVLLNRVSKQYSDYIVISWIDSTNVLWLFGGFGRDISGTQGVLNDLWKYDGTNWTWVSGSNTINAIGLYGTKGVANASNVPGARQKPAVWIDSTNNLWLLGGHGVDSAGGSGRLNDLWKYDGTNWTWISGNDLVDVKGIYGTKGLPSIANVPGGRWAPISWIDSNDILWLFSGAGWDSDSIETDNLNDLWKYDGTNWTWMGGRKVSGQPGVHGTQGIADPANIPGARRYSMSWIDSNDELLLFGGYGLDDSGVDGYMNDLWRITNP